MTFVFGTLLAQVEIYGCACWTYGAVLIETYKAFDDRRRMPQAN